MGRILIYNNSADTRSLYLHWPFCPYKCHFCPFVALASHDQFMGQYHEALKKEIIKFGQCQDQKRILDTIFIGGGTPSTYPAPLLLDTFGTLRTWFEINHDAEISIEVNPGTISREKLAAWQEAGISRLSVGVQSLKDDVLKKLNRLQSAQDVYALMNMAPAYINNISIDLIVGLPGVSIQEWQDIVSEVVLWPIKHVSVYFLSVHEDTPLYFGIKTKKITLPCDDDIVDLYCWTVQKLAAHGFGQYEVSNFAKPGFESRHNQIYWERRPYKGFGLGACSFDGAKRFQNQKNLLMYLKGCDEEDDITVFEEELTREQIYLEKIMLGMRRTQGIALVELMQGLTSDEQQQLGIKIGLLRDQNLIKESNSHIILTPAGLAVENEIVVKLSL